MYSGNIRIVEVENDISRRKVYYIVNARTNNQAMNIAIKAFVKRYRLKNDWNVSACTGYFPYRKLKNFCILLPKNLITKAREL